MPSRKPVVANCYLKAVDLRKDLKNEVLFSGVNLEVRVKNWLLLTGAAASGKTTLLRVLLGNLKPNFGYIERKAHLRQLKIEHEFIKPRQTLKQSLMAAGHKQGLSGEVLSRRLVQLSQILQFQPYLNQNRKTLAPSIYQLGCLAQAFLGPLDLVAFDEPLIYLTPEATQAFLKLLRQTQELGTAIIIVAATGSLFQADATQIYELSHANLKLVQDVSYTDLLRPHLIFERSPYAETLPEYLLMDTTILNQDAKTLDLMVKPARVNELTLELIKRGYLIKYLNWEII